MQTQKTGLDFKGQNIFVGIDVHLKSWAVTILTDNLVHKTFTQPASADTLSNYLKRFIIKLMADMFSQLTATQSGLQWLFCDLQ